MFARPSQNVWKTDYPTQNMKETQVYFPPKIPGLILHGFLILALLGGSGVLIYLAFSLSTSWSLILFLFGAILFLAIFPIVAYRAYALLHATYSVERDGLRVRWGLRSEDIPLTEVIWVRSATDLETPLRLPVFSMPGAVLGNSEHEDLGQLEFIASSVQNLVIVSSVNKTLVLSPEDPDEFVYKFQRVIEMGSLYPIPPHTAIPAAFIQQIFKDRLSRRLILSLLGMTILLIIITSLLIPMRPTVSLGYDLYGGLLPQVSSNRLLLLPVIATVFTFFDIIAGAFLFRRPDGRMVSYFVWSAGILMSLIMVLGVALLVLNSA